MLPDELRRALSSVRSMGVITGAGISADSGIPTYRGKGGLYDDPAEGERTVEALSGHTLRRDPVRTWRVVAALAVRSRAARPNVGHFALAALETTLERFVLLTQNVDGLHRLAGSRNIIDIHGDVLDTVCMACGGVGRIEDPEALTAIDEAPSCACGGTLRPGVVLFGETLPGDKLRRILAELVADPPDVVIAAGTTALFPYIVEPVIAARRAGRITIEVNPEETSLSDEVRFVLRGTCGDLLPAIATAIGADR